MVRVSTPVRISNVIRRHARPLLVSIACFAGSAEVFADGWTGFQGPVPTDARLDAVPLRWSATEGLAWKAAIPGYGQSSPVTWNGRVYVTSIAGANKETCHVTCFSLDSGETHWTCEFPAASQAESSNYISKAAPTPVVDEQGVVCFFEGGNLLALTHAGEVRWQRNLVADYGPIASRHGLAASLEQLPDRVFVWVERQVEPYVMAVDKATGKEIWKVAGLGVTSWASPRLIPVVKGPHLVLSGIGRLAGLDPATGKVLWTFDDIKGNSTPTPVPAGEGRFLIGATVGRGEADGGKAAESNGLVAIEQGAEGQYQAKFVWKSRRATSSFGSPLAHRGHAYFVNATGVLFCLDLETGEERYSNRLGDSIWATPIALGERVGFFGKGGVVSLIAAGPEFTKLAENATWEVAVPEAGTRPGVGSGGPVLYAAVYVQDRFLLRRGETLYCIASSPR